MSGQSQPKGGQGTTTQPYGTQPFQMYSPYNPAQQGSYFPAGTSSRAGFNDPNPMQYPGFGSFGPQGSPNPAYGYGGIFGSSTGYTPTPGATIPGAGATPFGPQPQGPYQPVAAQPPLSTQGLTQTQQGLGMGITPQGTMAFQGSIPQLQPGTARLMGFTQQGNNYVNAQGQIVGRV